MKFLKNISLAQAQVPFQVSVEKESLVRKFRASGNGFLPPTEHPMRKSTLSKPTQPPKQPI